MHFAKFIYHDNLEPKIWNKDASMNMLVQNSLMMIAWSYIAFLQQNGFPFADSDICDIFIHGSTSNYYYDDTSDIDLCIVANMESVRAALPTINLDLVLRSMLGSWKRNFAIRVAGRGIDITIVDVAKPVYEEGRYKVGGSYSMMHECWVNQSVKLTRSEVRTMRRIARKKYRAYKRMYNDITNHKMGDLYIETFMNKIKQNRVSSMDENGIQPVSAETMAFRMLRQRGIMRKMRNRVRELRSRNFNI